MPGQPQLFPDPEPTVLRPPAESAEGPRRAAPVWSQRLSLFVLVLFCVYLGVLVMILPWWTRIWDQNLFILSHPRSRRYYITEPYGVLSPGWGCFE